MSEPFIVFAVGMFVIALIGAGFLITVLEFRQMGREIRRGYGPHLVQRAGQSIETHPDAQESGESETLVNPNEQRSVGLGEA